MYAGASLTCPRSGLALAVKYEIERFGNDVKDLLRWLKRQVGSAPHTTPGGSAVASAAPASQPARSLADA